MEFFDKDILAGLDKVPATNKPGRLLCTGNSQAILTGPTPGDVFIAACKLGSGKIIATSHNCFLSWLGEKTNQPKIKFMNNIKLWLTGETEPKIIDFKEIVKKKDEFKNFKLIKWNQDFEPKDEDLKDLLKFISEGGALFCGITPWGFLQSNPKKKLSELKMFQFLKQNAGIILTKDVLTVPNEIKIGNNKAKISQFDIAVEKVCANPSNVEKYCNTIFTGIDVLSREGLINKEKILNLKKLLCENCTNSGWNTTPKKDEPVCSLKEKNAVKILGKCMNFAKGEKAPGINSFPGDFEEQPELLKNVELELQTKFKERVSTGYYLPAGVILTVKLISGKNQGWTVRVGAHTDNLSNCDSFKRWPNVCVSRDLAKEFTMSSPFGGLIYLESPAAGTVKVSFTNVVESPLYDLTKPLTIQNWQEKRNAPGLWAELAGENIIFTTPSSCVRHIEDPREVIEFWDSVVKTHHECRGTNVKEFRRERVVNDLQPSAGYMHSGYPIVTHLDCCQKDCNECIFDVDKLRRNGSWGLFHEIGHNLQRGEWTFDGATEVTVNIFSMHANEFVLGQNILKQSWPRDKIPAFEKYFSKQPTYQDWKNNVGMGLMTFVQLIKHFGWESMHKFMSDYEKDMKNNRKALPKTNQDKIDQWVLRYSKIVSKNIKPQFEMFGLPVSEKVDQELADLEKWCPVEEKDGKVFFSQNEE